MVLNEHNLLVPTNSKYLQLGMLKASDSLNVAVLGGDEESHLLDGLPSSRLNSTNAES